MKILAIDTATEACSVALLLNDVCHEVFEIIPRQHTERVLPMVDELLNKADISLSQLDALAFNCGPGSFTGVRVGTSVIQGLAFSCDLPVVSVSSLAALAQLAFRKEKKERILSAIDARMNEVYWGFYTLESGVMKLYGEEKVSHPSDIRHEGDGSWHCLGSGWDNFKTEFNDIKNMGITSSMQAQFPHAQDIAYLAVDLFTQGMIQKAEDVTPTYIRNEVTWKKISQQ